MATKISAKTTAALKALQQLQEDARRKGLDTTAMEQINAEIAKLRREKQSHTRLRSTTLMR